MRSRRPARRLRARRTVTRRLRAPLAVLAAAALVAGCGSGTPTAAGDDPTTGTGASAGSPAATGDPSTADPGTPTPQESVDVVESTVTGVAVAGNAGGEEIRDDVLGNATDSYSETVRFDDGTCTGWPGRTGVTPWTEGLVEGAAVRIVAVGSDQVLGRGTLGRPQVQHVDGGPDGGQWMCSFPFTATVEGPVPERFRIRVDGADDMEARRDPTRAGAFVASVSTVASARVGACLDPYEGEPVLWEQPVAGTYWNAGVSTVCGGGVKVTKVERVCRPPAVASDHVVAVLDADDPSRVLEDVDGRRVSAVEELGPSRAVVVRVANGRPCG
jgi:hypothetical protein